MSDEHSDQMPPRLATARKLTMVSGTFGMMATTRSPEPTPSPFSDAASAATRARSSPHEISFRAPPSVA